MEYGEYKARLADWEAERRRQKYEFTITEDDLDADKRIGSPEIVVSVFISKLMPLDQMIRGYIVFGLFIRMQL